MKFPKSQRWQQIDVKYFDLVRDSK